MLVIIWLYCSLVGDMKKCISGLVLRMSLSITSHTSSSISVNWDSAPMNSSLKNI